jgi:hypothetical protein
MTLECPNSVAPSTTFDVLGERKDARTALDEMKAICRDRRPIDE